MAEVAPSTDDGVRDVFLSHASEDKDGVARPLARELQALGLSVWYDEFSLALGDSLRREIDRGLALARFGVVILSPHFLAKEWPQRELDGLTARETATGRKIILPVWHGVTSDDIRRYSPTLADRVAVASTAGAAEVAAKIAEVVTPAESHPDHQRGADSQTERADAIDDSAPLPTELFRNVEAEARRTGLPPDEAGAARERVVEGLHAVSSGRTASPESTHLDAPVAIMAWNPAVRLALRQRLCFARYAFLRYDASRIASAFAHFLAAARIGGFTYNEVHGIHDVWLSMWLPPSLSVGDLRELAQAALSASSLVQEDVFYVDEIVQHWIWPSLARRDLDLDAEVAAQVDHGNADRGVIDGLVNRGSLARASFKPGIRFYLTVTTAALRSLPEIAQTGEWLKRVLASAPLTECALYRGDGFAQFVIEAKIHSGDWSTLTEQVVDPINQSLNPLGVRTYATFASRSAPTLARDVLTLPDTSGASIDA